MEKNLGSGGGVGVQIDACTGMLLVRNRVPKFRILVWER